ncbi:oxygen-independent coproporphyrinogen III oxidase [Sphingosinithalassobacter sp. CS137]|uniref:oxygen-independent coproporphyrinogen III oxidase n=1 Tax=Sphingosinithalassobacter sp. CS137 TaxID=2762748 RepID=UPI00165E7030|nr:oxygen-independent coproporphyrinogen III oxidase [Sphingosinithalassobacter sp. CS137]
MHRYLPDLAAQSVPRYTSYPIAVAFAPGIGAAEQVAAQQAIAPGTPVSLYLHIPYCHEICWYCGCNTGATGRPDRVSAYRDALLREIETVGARVRGTAVSVHFGGGSPNALAPADWAEIAAGLRSAFDIAPHADWAAELDPRTLSAADAQAIAAAGIGRASLGAQTFAPHIQHRINRIQPFRTVAQAAADLRAAGVARINLDLMYGLPDQRLDAIAATVAQALTLRPDRVAMFGYAHMPRMLPRQRMIDSARLPDAEARFWQSALAHDLMLEAGYRAIGFDHFALPGDSIAQAAREGRLRRNFQGFTDDPATTVIGLGASAISQFDTLFVQNEKHSGRYRMLAGNGAPAGVRGAARTAGDRLRGAVIERLLCDGTVDVAAVAAAHRQPVEALAESLPALAPLVDAGMVAVAEWRVTVLPAGRPYARLAAAAFDAYRAPAADRFSRAV